jgi:hypothetical protein
MLSLTYPCVPCCTNSHCWIFPAASCSMISGCVSVLLVCQQGWLCGTVSIPSRNRYNYSQYRFTAWKFCNASALSSLAAVVSLLRTYCYTVANTTARTTQANFNAHCITYPVMHTIQDIPHTPWAQCTHWHHHRHLPAVRKRNIHRCCGNARNQHVSCVRCPILHVVYTWHCAVALYCSVALCSQYIMCGPADAMSTAAFISRHNLHWGFCCAGQCPCTGQSMKPPYITVFPRQPLTITAISSSVHIALSIIPTAAHFFYIPKVLFKKKRERAFPFFFFLSNWFVFEKTNQFDLPV